MYRKYNKILKQVYKQENLLQNLGQMLGAKFRIDWIGRVYAVINPSIQNNQYDANSQIFEYGPDGLSDLPGVESWLMRRLNIVQQFVQAQNIFDLLTFKLKKLDNNNNFLFILQPLPLDDLKTYTKRFLLLILCLILIGTGLLIFL
jgi:hypothetical protein